MMQRLLVSFLVALSICWPAQGGRISLLGAGKPGGVSCPAGTTFDPANKGSNTFIVLSNCDLTATGAGAASSYESNVRSTTYSGGGLSVTFASFLINEASNGIGVGIVNSSFPIGTSPIAVGIDFPTARSIGYYQDGQVWRRGFVENTLATYTSGDTIDMLLDEGQGFVAFRKNSGSVGNWNNNVANDPATGATSLGPAGGPFFVAVQVWGDTGVSSQVTVTFHAPFTYAAPGGSLEW